MNLNGWWKFRVDDECVGLENRWFAGMDFNSRILVPFALESEMSGIADRAFHSCVWYQRSFTIPDEWSGRRIRLNFGAVDYRATVWVNGIIVATHEGGHTPFSSDITGALNFGRNTLVVRAEDPPTDRYIPRGKQHWEMEPISIFYARTTGIWQTVWLEPVAPGHIETLRITPSLNGRVEFSVGLAVASMSQIVRVTIRHEGREVASAMSLADGPSATVTATVPEPYLWSPDSPALYDVHL